MRLPVAALTWALVGTLAPPSPATSQTTADPSPAGYTAAQWTVDDGLPANLVTSIAQDSTGYLWVATLQGLARFDGARFTAFTAAESGLPSDRIEAVRAAADGAIWLVTEQNHLARLRDGTVTRFDGERGLPDRTTASVHVDGRGVVWAATREGLYRLVEDRFTRVAEGEIQGPVSVIAGGRDGETWVGTGEDGLYRIDGEGVTRIDATPGAALQPVTALWPDRDGTVWIGGSGGLWRWRDGGTVEAVVEPGAPGFTESRVTDIRPSPTTGEVWIAAPDGIWRWSDRGLETVARRSAPGLPPLRTGPRGLAWYAVRDELYRDREPVFRLPDPGPDDVSANYQVNDVFWDREGSVWVATVRRGLFRLRPAAVRVLGVQEGLPDRNVTVLLEDGAGAVWVGSRGGGLARVEGDVVTRYGAGQGVGRSVGSLMRDRLGGVWVGGARFLVRCAPGGRGCDAAPGRLPDDFGTVFALHEDRSGGVWAGTGHGLLRFTDGAWAPMETGLPTSVPVRAFLERGDGALFMATRGAGVLVWRNGRFSRLGEAEGLPTGFVRSLYLDRDGHLWVGTEGYGLARVTLEETEDAVSPAAVRLVQQRDGLPDNVIHQLLEDDAGRLWMSTNRGLARVRLDALEAFADGDAPRVQAVVYTERDGLRNREGNGGLFPPGIRTRDGRLWFATQDGVAIVDPADAPDDPAPPPVAVERVVTPTRALAVGATPIALEADERDFEIDYTALGLAAPENVRFRYRLEGRSEAWTEAGARRTAYFTQVPPGDYTFRVVASSGEGAWSAAGAALPLRVAPRFHETTAARLLFAAAALSALFVVFQWRIRSMRARERELTLLVDARTVELRQHERRLEAQNARLAEMDRAKSRLFTDLSHEFRTPLTLILGPLRGLLEGRHGELSPSARAQGDLMLRNGQRLLRLVNQVLDLSRLEAGHVVLDPRRGDLVAFARATTLAFSPLAERRRIDLTFRADRPSLPLTFDREQLEKVLLNLLSNALKFTAEDGAVDVSVTREGGAAVIAVRDSGIGIAADELPHVFDRFRQSSRSDTRRHEGSGIGLALAKELVELHGGEIRAESRPGEGSTFVVRLPWSGEGAEEGAPEEAEVEEARALEPEDVGAAGVEASVPVASPVPVGGEPTEEDEDRTTVLIVDDNADVRAYVRSVLSTTYRVLEAVDGRAGLERARTALPDLVVADVMMPEMDGLALGRALKGDPMTDAIPLVLLTAKAEAGDRVEGLRTGADAYLVKPFDPHVLEAQVANLLEQRRRLRERFRSGEVPPEPPGAAAGAAHAAPSELDLRLRPIVEARLHDSDFGPYQLADAADLSYHQLYRALKAELDASPSHYIRTVRVERAATLLSRREGTVTEIGYSVGFESLSYFNRCYRERFGVPPSRHLGADVPVSGG